MFVITGHLFFKSSVNLYYQWWSSSVADTTNPIGMEIEIKTGVTKEVVLDTPGIKEVTFKTPVK